MGRILYTQYIYYFQAAGLVLLVGAIGISIWRSLPAHSDVAAGAAFGLSQLSITFLNDYWLHFELTSVLLVAAVVAALAVIRVSRKADERRRHG